MKNKIRYLLSLPRNGRLRKKSNYVGVLLLMHFSFSAKDAEATMPAGIEQELHVSTSTGSTSLSHLLIEADSSTEKMKNKPKWVDMMYDPNVNYFEAKKQFEDFWEDRGEPEEKDEKEEKEKRSLFKRLLKSDAKIEEENAELLLPYKRFKKWLIDMEPYVQPDGTVSSIEEQKKIWENARR